MARVAKDLRKEVLSLMGEELANVGASGLGAAPVTTERKLDLGIMSRQRSKIKPIPDPEAGATARRKESAKKRKQRGGRASTILSEGSETLG